MCSFYASSFRRFTFRLLQKNNTQLIVLHFFSQLQFARAVFSALDTVQSTERHPQHVIFSGSSTPCGLRLLSRKKNNNKNNEKKCFWEVARVVVVITFGGFFANDDHGNDTVQRPRTIAGSFSGSDERRGKQRLAQSGRFVGV